MSLDITCQELHQKLENGDKIKLIDCREPGEWDIVRIEGAQLIPMKQTPAHLNEIKIVSEPLVVYCHHGMRSQQVAGWLRSQGVENVQSLAGGIHQWSLEIDPSLPRY